MATTTKKTEITQAETGEIWGHISRHRTYTRRTAAEVAADDYKFAYNKWAKSRARLAVLRKELEPLEGEIEELLAEAQYRGANPVLKGQTFEWDADLGRGAPAETVPVMEYSTDVEN